jgi:hypothetical protein
MSNLDTGNVLGIFAFLVSICGVIYTAINHKRFRLRCCGNDIDVSVDVEDTKKPGDQEEKSKSETKQSVMKSEERKERKESQESQVEAAQESKKKNEALEEEEVEEETFDRRKQNIRENERNEALKAQYALRVANARKYNRRVAPLPPLLPP